MVRRCGTCRQPGHDRRRCPENVIAEVPPANRGRGGSVRGRGRGRGRGGQLSPAMPARHNFIRASEINQHIEEYDFNLDEIFDAAEYDPEPIITEEDELNFYQGIALGEQLLEQQAHLLEQQADYEEGVAELYADLEPGLILQELYPDVDWANMPAQLLPRICSKTRCHVDNQIVPDNGTRHANSLCTFPEDPDRTRCNLCLGDDTAKRALGKERLREVLILKMQWVEEDDQEVRDGLMAEMQELKRGTIALDVVVSSLKFIHLTAKNISIRDPEFNLEEAIDFILRVYVEGRVRGTATPLTVEERQAYFERIDTEAFTCSFTGRRLQFFRSFLGDMASPDRVVWRKEGTKWKVLPYSHPDQVTVRSSWWANSFYNKEPFRDAFHFRLNREYLNDNGALDFTGKFDTMNDIIKRFLVTLPSERINLNHTAVCLVPDSKVKELFKSIKGNANGMCGGGNVPLRPSVNDFSDWQELQSFFKAFHSRCVISGLTATRNNTVMLSPDRKIDSTGRYNWTDTIPMMWNLNTAKASCRYIYEKEENLQLWYDENSDDFERLVNETILLDFDTNPVAPVDDPIEVIETWVVVLEQRKYFMALLNHYRSRNNPTFFQDIQGEHYQEPESDPDIEFEEGLDFE